MTAPIRDGSMTRLTAVEVDELERDYVAHRAMVLAMLRAEFRLLPDTSSPGGMRGDA